MKILPLLCIAALLCPSPIEAQSAGKIVYQSQFEKGISSQWIRPRIAMSPKGNRFLGIFGNRTTASLVLPELPAHKLMRVRFALYQIYSPDGSQQNYGPDYSGLSVDGRPELFRTTFNFSHSNEPEKHPQAFPDDYPIEHPAGTGSDERGSLGYYFKVEPEIQAKTSDMVFKLDVVFPHDGPSAELQFWSEFTHGAPDEAWGIGSVEVEVLPEFTHRSDAEMQALWDKLLGKDPMAAWKALWQLAECGPAATAFAAKQLGGDEIRQRIAGLIRDLSSGEVVAQEKARNAIEKLEPRALPVLRTALQDPATPARFRNEFADLVADLKAESPYFMTRVSRLLRVLDTPESRTQLTTLTGNEGPGATAPNDSFARLVWRASHAAAEDPWVLRSFFTPDGKSILSAAGDGVRVWDAATGRLQRFFVAPSTRGLAISPDGTRAIVGVKTSQAAVWDVATGALRQAARGHAGEVWSVAFFPDSERFVTAADDGIRWWEPGVNASLSHATLLAPPRHLAMSPDGKLLALNECGNGQNVVTLRDATTGELKRRLATFPSAIPGISFSPDGKLVAVAPYRGGVSIYDVETGVRRHHFEGTKPDNECAVFSPDGQHICIAGGGGREQTKAAQDQRGIRIHRLSDGAEVWRNTAFVESCLSAAFSPDGKFLFAGDSRRNVYMWEIFRAPSGKAPK